MKRIVSMFLMVSLIVCMFAGCGGNGNSSTSQTDDSQSSSASASDTGTTDDEEPYTLYFAYQVSKEGPNQQKVNEAVSELTIEALNIDVQLVPLTAGTYNTQMPMMLAANERIPTEELSEGDRIKVYVVEVRKSTRGPQVLISRTHPGLVKRLFELEVPEIFDGTVEIKSIAREAGSRTKIAVYSNNPEVDPIGACVGPKGGRVATIVDELRGEKIDIARYSDTPEDYIASALAPSDVVSVTMLEDGKSCRVIVPDSQLSLAIGKEGQNVRLAARLTGYKIDIKPESQA